ncbi:MAG: amidohydrolase [Burkholderiales bacterium]|nr:amidohydrolase [Burkholderiales bacterium]
MSFSPCACGIDVHAHVVPEHFPAYLGRTVPNPWPSTTAAPDSNGLCHRHVMVNGKNYRTVSEKSWSATRRIADLPEMGLEKQVISPMPELLSYWLPLNDAQPLIRFLNEYTAEICDKSEGKLLGLAAVPLQDMDTAVAELHYAVNQLGLAGVEIGSNINGTTIGDSRFDPFFAACVELDVPVFVHAIKPAGMDRLVGPAPLQQVLAYPTDVGLAAASVITGGLLIRYPKLRIAFSHGGGTLAMLLPRLQQGWTVFPALAESIPESPAELSKKMFFDTLVFDPAALKYLASIFGTQGLMLGTDYPFNFHERRPVERLVSAGFDPVTCDALTFGNARRFLGNSIF